MQHAVHVLTVATHHDGYLPALVSTLPSLKILGFGAKWRGYTTKIQHVREYLNSVPDLDIVIFCDAYDVLVDPRKTLDDVVKTFKNLRVDALFSANDYASQCFLARYHARRTMNGIPNADGDRLLSCNPGLYMGYAAPLREMLEDILVLAKQNRDNDDERLLNELLNTGRRLSVTRLVYRETYIIALDLEERVFHNHIPCEDVYSLARLVLGTYVPPRDVISSRSCFFYHFIGNQNLDELCAYEGIMHSRQKRVYTNLMKTKHYIKYFVAEIFVVILIIVVLFVLN